MIITQIEKYIPQRIHSSGAVKSIQEVTAVTDKKQKEPTYFSERAARILKEQNLGKTIEEIELGRIIDIYA